MILKQNKKRVYHDRIEVKSDPLDNLSDNDYESPTKLRKGDNTMKYMTQMLQMCQQNHESIIKTLESNCETFEMVKGELVRLIGELKSEGAIKDLS